MYWMKSKHAALPITCLEYIREKIRGRLTREVYEFFLLFLYDTFGPQVVISAAAGLFGMGKNVLDVWCNTTFLGERGKAYDCFCNRVDTKWSPSTDT